MVHSSVLRNPDRQHLQVGVLYMRILRHAELAMRAAIIVCLLGAVLVLAESLITDTLEE